MSAKKKKNSRRGYSRRYLYTAAAILVSAALLALFVNPSLFRDDSTRKTVYQETPPLRKDARVHFHDRETGSVKATVTVQVAEYENERVRGLMFRKSLAGNEGMLFIFERSELRSFWMRNTFISLDIMYLDEEYRIIDIHHRTEPLSTAPIRSSGEAKYVVETRGGFCQEHGIAEGDTITVERMGNT